MFKRFRHGHAASDAARRLYDATISRARAPVFYTHFAVPDTIDGRFDLLTLHAFLVLEVLGSSDPVGKERGAELVDLLFGGFEEALRELGVSDFGIARRMKAMAGAFYGRLEAYRRASTAEGLATALVRNVYRGARPPGSEAATLARYMLVAKQHLCASSGDLLDGDAHFGPLPKL